MEIPGYKIEKQIGKGGMATVYLAVQESLGRPVVLKVMSTQLGDSPEFAKRFLNEGHLLAAINHPNVNTIFDIGIAEDFLYISMEYLGGGDLTTKLADGPMDPGPALDILYQIGSALGVAHAKGIIHRDVKPANILYRADGTPVLTDFGIAKLLGDNELTSTGTILGSPFYMSPEQVEGRMELDGRSDIYSLGIIFYEMLTGKRPYEGESAINIVLQHIQKPVPALPQNLNAYQPLLTIMLAKNRDERIPNAEALKDYVRALKYPNSPENTRFLKRHSIQEVERSGPKHYVAGDVTQKLAREHRRRLRAWALMGAAVVSIGAVLTWYFVSEINRYGIIERGPSPAARAANVATPQTPPLAPTRAASQADAFRLQVTTALKWLARRSLEEQRLTSPPEDNAHYYFSRLLEIDPGNAQALEGIAEVAKHYATMAEEQVRRKNYQLAANYIAQGLRVDPDNKQLHVLKSNMELREKSFLESVLELLGGQS